MTILVRHPVGRAEDPDQGPGAARGPKPPRLRAPSCLREGRLPSNGNYGHHRNAIAISTRRFSSYFAVLLLATLVTACGNETARAPNPTAYAWPDSFAYRIALEARAKKDTEIIARHEETKELRFVARDDGTFAVWRDSVRRTEAWRGAAPSETALWPEDTLHYFVRLSRWGEFLSIEPGCDPAVTACREVPPSALPRELRQLIPRLPVWWPPKGSQWEDTLAFDDRPRPRGVRGTSVTVYRAARDTAVGDRAYWIVTWHAVQRAARSAAGGAIVAEPVVEENGRVLVDKQLLIPALSEWWGATLPPPELRALGATRMAIRGRAVLVGSGLDTLPFTEEVR
ncbi:MAG: hypothetical protein ABR998_01975 [Gemmatimonadales bacterium]|jgi:hypothetical protein